MIDYEEESLWPLLFHLRGSVYVRSCAFAVPAACLTFLLVLLERWTPNYREETFLASLNSGTLWSMSTAVLVFTVGFRTKQAYSRFWEGTGLLHQMKGEWFDTVSNCVTFTIAAPKEKEKEVLQFRHTIVRLMSLCYGSALEEISGIEGRMEVIDVCGLNTSTLRHLKECVETHKFNKVEVLLHLLQSLITHSLFDGIINIPAPILSRVYQTISRGYVNLLNAKKITDTKFPFPYVQLIAVSLFLHMLLTPIIVSVTVDSLFIAPALAFISIFGTHALNFISVELEDPFGEDDNDLPLAHFQAEMNNCLLMLLHPRTDIVADVSDNCIMDFQTLKDTVCLDEVKGGGPTKRSSVKLFDPTFHIIGTRSNLEQMTDLMSGRSRGRVVARDDTAVDVDVNISNGGDSDASGGGGQRCSLFSGAFPSSEANESECTCPEVNWENIRSEACDERLVGLSGGHHHRLSRGDGGTGGPGPPDAALAVHAGKCEDPSRVAEAPRIALPVMFREGHSKHFEAAAVALDTVRTHAAAGRPTRSPCPEAALAASREAVETLLVKNLEDFNSSLKLLTDAMECQLRDVAQRLATLRAIENQYPQGSSI